MGRRKAPKAGQFGSATGWSGHGETKRIRLNGCKCKQKSCRQVYVGVSTCSACSRCCPIHKDSPRATEHSLSIGSGMLCENLVPMSDFNWLFWEIIQSWPNQATITCPVCLQQRESCLQQHYCTNVTSILTRCFNQADLLVLTICWILMTFLPLQLPVLLPMMLR